MRKKNKLALLFALFCGLMLVLSACSSDNRSPSEKEADKLNAKYGRLIQQPYITIEQANDLFADAANWQGGNQDDFATLIDKMNHLRVVDNGDGSSYHMLVKQGKFHVFGNDTKASYKLQPIYDSSKATKQIQIDPNWQKEHADLTKETK